MNRAAVSTVAAAVVACAQMAFAPGVAAGPRDEMITKHAAANGVPEKLIRRVIHIESRGNPRVISKGNYGLMQIRLGTARSMGYSGTAEGLLDADTNMTYAVKYLARAYRAARCNPDRAISYYQRGFYGTALAKCGAPAETQVAQTAKVETNALARSAAGSVEPSDVLQPRVVHVETFTKSKVAAPAPVKSAKFEPVRVAPPQAEPSAVAVAVPVASSADTAAPKVAAVAPPAEAKSGPQEKAAQPAEEVPAKAVTVAALDAAHVPLPRVRPAKAPKRVAVAELSAAVTVPPATEQAPPSEAAKIDAAPSAEPEVKVAKLDATAPLPRERPEIPSVVEKSESKSSAARSKAKWARHFRHHRGHRRAKAEKPVGLIAFLQKITAPEKKSRRHRSR